MPRWLVYCAASMLCWAIWSLISPIASRDLSPYMVQVISTAGLVPCALLLLFSKRLKQGSQYRKGILFAFGCGLFSGVGNLFLYLALASNGPASVIFPLTAMPVLQVLAGPLLFKEHISRLQSVGVGLALASIVLLNITPGGPPAEGGIRLISTWMLFALLSLLSYGIAMTSQKAATYYISDELSTVVYTVAFVLLAAGLLVTVHPASWHISAGAGWASFFIGILMGVGTLLLFAAYRYGKATIVSPFVLMYPLITVLVAVPLYRESIDWLRGSGIFFALSAVFFLSLEKKEETVPPSSGNDSQLETEPAEKRGSSTHYHGMHPFFLGALDDGEAKSPPDDNANS